MGNRQLDKIQNVSQGFLISQSSMNEWLEKWQRINGNIDKLLPSPQNRITPVSINPDVTAYSFDRVVVCNSDNIAQLLIANNFHFENNCAILSINGYPQNIFDTTMEMLRRNLDLQVFAFHDCTPQGVSVIHHLRTSEKWFLNSDIKIIDIGLLPRQILSSKKAMFIQQSRDATKQSQKLSLEIRTKLLAEELVWLDTGNTVELESFTPQQVIKMLQNGIFKSKNLNSTNNSIVFLDNADFRNNIYIYHA